MTLAKTIMEKVDTTSHHLPRGIHDSVPTMSVSGKGSDASRMSSRFLRDAGDRGTCFTISQGCKHQNPDGGEFYWTDCLVSSTEENVTEKKMKMEPRV